MNEDLNKNILKTGTSIVGIVCKDGIVMAADRQVSAGNLVVSKHFQKLNKVSDYLVVAWTGNVADAQLFAKLLAAELKLKELKDKRRPTVREAANLLAMVAYKSIRQFSTIPSIVGTLIAGINEDKTFELYTIDPSGSIVQVEDYDANFSSGMPYILGLLERQYKPNLSLKDGIKLALEALKSSTQRDMGSGYGIDIWTIDEEGVKPVVKQKIESVFK